MTPLMRRLMPLYVANFLQGFILWYTVEKLFMQHIGFDNASIGMMVAAYSAVMLLVETPSGILADRWSRKGVLIIASAALSLSSLVGGISHGIPMYLFCAGLWGLFFALYSGAYDSIVYDTLLEVQGDAANYKRYYGRVKIIDSVALVLSSVMGGLLAAHWGLRVPYFLTIPIAALSIVPLLLFREPKLHKQHALTHIMQQVRRTFHAVAQKGRLRYVLGALVLISTASYGMFEFNQLWLIALGLPVGWIGAANATLLATIGLGGVAASKLHLHRLRAMQLAIVAVCVVTIGLALWRSAVPVVLFQVVFGVGTTALIIVFTAMLHDALPSAVRAGASSAVGTLTRIITIPFSLLFGYIGRQADVFASSWVLVALVIVAFLAATKVHTAATAADATGDATGDVAELDPEIAETYQK